MTTGNEIETRTTSQAAADALTTRAGTRPPQTPHPAPHDALNGTARMMDLGVIVLPAWAAVVTPRNTSATPW